MRPTLFRANLSKLGDGEVVDGAASVDESAITRGIGAGHS
jgi:high-affinity K+ transport system ATPase subunit B